MNKVESPNLGLSALAGRYVPVIIDGAKYAIREDRVRARASLAEMLRRTDLPDFVAGLVTRRGRVIPVFDLHGGISPGSAPPAGGCILVVQSRPADQPGIPVGLCVDWIGEPVNVPAADISTLTLLESGRPRLDCLGTVQGVGGLLDVDGIVGRSLFAAAVSGAGEAGTGWRSS